MRLTKQVKSQIVNDIISDKVTIINKQIAVKSNQLFSEMYEKYFTADEHKLLQQMPDDWKYSIKQFEFLSEDVKNPKRYYSSYHYIRHQLSFDFPKSQHSPVFQTTDKALIKKIVSFLNFKYEKQSDIADLKKRTEQIINAATTSKKLKELWPDISNIVDKYRPHDSGQLPVNQLEIVQLTKELGL